MKVFIACIVILFVTIAVVTTNGLFLRQGLKDSHATWKTVQHIWDAGVHVQVRTLYLDAKKIFEEQSTCSPILIPMHLVANNSSVSQFRGCNTAGTLPYAL